MGYIYILWDGDDDDDDGGDDDDVYIYISLTWGHNLVINREGFFYCIEMLPATKAQVAPRSEIGHFEGGHGTHRDGHRIGPDDAMEFKWLV